MNKKIFFMHIPKCGGTSIKKSLINAVGQESVFSLDAHASKFVKDSFPKEESLFGIRHKLILYALASDQYKLAMGHALFAQKDFGALREEVNFVSLVRDPVERFISQYYFNRYKKSTHFKIDLSFDDFLSSEQSEEYGGYLLRYFSGLDHKNDINAALDNLDYFSVIGVLENLDKFRRDLANEFGLKLNIMHSNENPIESSERDETLTESRISRIRDLCEKDLIIYDRIVKRMAV